MQGEPLLNGDRSASPQEAANPAVRQRAQSDERFLPEPEINAEIESCSKSTQQLNAKILEIAKLLKMSRLTAPNRARLEQKQAYLKESLEHVTLRLRQLEAARDCDPSLAQADSAHPPNSSVMMHRAPDDLPETLKERMREIEEISHERDVLRRQLERAFQQREALLDRFVAAQADILRRTEESNELQQQLSMSIGERIALLRQLSERDRHIEAEDLTSQHQAKQMILEGERALVASQARADELERERDEAHQYCREAQNELVRSKQDLIDAESQNEELSRRLAVSEEYLEAAQRQSRAREKQDEDDRRRWAEQKDELETVEHHLELYASLQEQKQAADRRAARAEEMLLLTEKELYHRQRQYVEECTRVEHLSQDLQDLQLLREQLEARIEQLTSLVQVS